MLWLTVERFNLFQFRLISFPGRCYSFCLSAIFLHQCITLSWLNSYLMLFSQILTTCCMIFVFFISFLKHFRVTTYAQVHNALQKTYTS